MDQNPSSPNQPPAGSASESIRLDPEIQTWLANLLERVRAAAGTVHLQQRGALELVGAINIPEKVQQITRQIPKGKGMAGLAWERGVPVQTCNLKEDRSGDVRPGAKAVDAKAAAAIPIYAQSGELRAVVGVAFMEDRELSEEEMSKLTELAGTLPL